MTSQPSAPRRPSKFFLTAVGVIATLTVFAIDIFLPHGYDISSLYALTVLVAGFSQRRKIVIRTTIGSWGLTLLAFWLKEHDAPHGFSPTEVFSRVISIAVITMVAIVLIAVIQRGRENSELGRALRAVAEAREIDTRMLDAASSVAPIGTWSLDMDDERMDMSAETAMIYGIAPGERPLRTEVLSFLDAEDARLFKEDVVQALEFGTPFRNEVRVNRPDGSHRWTLSIGGRVQLDGDSRPRLQGTIQDITMWKEAELAATFQGHRFSQLTRSLPIIVWTANPQGRIDYFNEALVHYTGVDADTLLRDQAVSVIDPRDLPGLDDAWQSSVKSGQEHNTEYRIRGADGVYRWHHVSAQPERDNSGKIVRWWGSSINIDANKHLREEADAAAAEREVILDSMSEGVYALDHESRIIYVNPSAIRILDLHRNQADIRGEVLWELFPELVDTEFHRFLTATKESGIAGYLSYHSLLADKWLELSATPTPTGITVFFRDATELRRLSQQLAQSQRLESIGQLTGGIAHDFNNLLTVVLGGADALTADESLTEESREMATLIASAAERGAELTHRLLAFARRQPLEPRSVDISERIAELGPLLHRTLGEDITVAVSTEGDSVAEVDPGQFENALLNLAINARDAMPLGGSVGIEVGNVVLDESYVTAHAVVAPGNYVVVTVTDSGTGIDAQDMGNLFDPFFTTKETTKGSGLGLAMVWGFVKQSGGHITVYSEKDYGTSFRMYLPAALSAPAASDALSGQIPTRPASGTILLAEDDDLVRVFATDRLRAKGYEVIATASGKEALQVLESMERVDLLFTDVKMPGGMSGRELADAVVASRPGTPILYASGYTKDVITHNDRLDPGVNLLAKPYSTRQLLERVGGLLAATERAEP